MNKTEYIGKLNALYVGEKNCLEELITIYDEKDKETERLNNIIKEVRKYIEKEYVQVKNKEYNLSWNNLEYIIKEILDKLNQGE